MFPLVRSQVAADHTGEVLERERVPDVDLDGGLRVDRRGLVDLVLDRRQE